MCVYSLCLYMSSIHLLCTSSLIKKGGTLALACTGRCRPSVVHMCVGCLEIYSTCPLQPGQGSHHCLCMYSLSLYVQVIHIQCHVLRASRGDRPTAASARLLALVELEPRPTFKPLFGAPCVQCDMLHLHGHFILARHARTSRKPLQIPSPPKRGLRSHAWGAPLDHCGALNTPA
jgi:hypothetical protein